MFFSTVLRSIGIPVVAFLLLKDTSLQEDNAFLAVTITLTIANFLSIILQLVRMIPNAMMLRGRRIVNLALRIFIEVASVVGFWIYYLRVY